jgi:hypothetical protein
MGPSHWQKVWIVLILGLLWVFPLSPAAAAGPPEIILEKEAPPKEEGAKEPAKDETPCTCGPLLSDTCLPIEKGKVSLQYTAGLAMVGGNFNRNWRSVGAGGDFATFINSVKFTFGPAKNLELYTIIPYIHNFASSVNEPGPRRERSADYGGIGDISLFSKYLLLEETPARPAVTGVFGVGFPTGHASHLNPGRLNMDAIGTGAYTFTWGFNLYKCPKPLLVYSNIWYSKPLNADLGGDRVRSRDFVTFNLAAEWPITKRWVALLEFYSTWTWSDAVGPQGFQSPSTLLGILPGIEFIATEKWSAAVGVAIDLAGKDTSFKRTPMFTIIRSF